MPSEAELEFWDEPSGQKSLDHGQPKEQQADAAQPKKVIFSKQILEGRLNRCAKALDSFQKTWIFKTALLLFFLVCFLPTITYHLDLR